MQILSNNRAVFGAALVATLLLISAGMFTQSVAAASIFDIEFPVEELGGCADKTACKAYCDEAENAGACRAFAERHGLGSTQEKVKAKVDQITSDGGPGGCAEGAKNPGSACKAYCDSSKNIEECVAYARENKLMSPPDLADAEKVVSALKRGAKLPSQCQNAKSCKQVCENPEDMKTARACFAFGKEAGLLPPDVTAERAEKVFVSLERGNGPFKSFAEMRQCENPQSDEVLQKCLDFGIQAGFIPPEEVEIIKKTGGKGPGNCRGREQCDTYCRENQKACFAFAQEHGLVSPEDQTRMQEGATRMRQGLEQAPPEVAKCVRQAVPNLDSALGGDGFIGKDVGEKMRTCFESFKKDQMNEFKNQDRKESPPSGPPQGFGPGEFKGQGPPPGFNREGAQGGQFPPQPPLRPNGEGTRQGETGTDIRQPSNNQYQQPPQPPGFNREGAQGGQFPSQPPLRPNGDGTRQGETGTGLGQQLQQKPPAPSDYSMPPSPSSGSSMSPPPQPSGDYPTPPPGSFIPPTP